MITLYILEPGILIIDLCILTFDLDIVQLNRQSILLDDQSSFSINQLLDHSDFSQIASPQPSPALITGTVLLYQCTSSAVCSTPSAPRLPVSHTGEGSDDLSISRRGPFGIPSSPPPAVTPQRSSASFPSGQMNFFTAVDRRALRSYIDDLFDCAESRQDVLDDYSAIQDQL